MSRWDCSEYTIYYNKMMEALTNCDIPLQNWVGFCADTTNAMMGQNNSVSQSIRKNHPHVIISKCSCHIIHLVASYACSKMSNSLEDFCRKIYNHFSRSPKHTEVLREFQVFYETEPHKMLRPCQTRWLSLQQCVDRILEQWDALSHYFILQNHEDPTHVNTHIIQTLQNPLLKCLMHFVSYSLSLFNDYNCHFQVEYPQFPELKARTEELLKTLALNFLNGKYVRSTPAFEIDPSQKKEYVPLNKIYIHAIHGYMRQIYYQAFLTKKTLKLKNILSQ